jgi:hypothetical protein
MVRRYGSIGKTSLENVEAARGCSMIGAEVNF